jgi:hypothetical protein
VSLSHVEISIDDPHLRRHPHIRVHGGITVNSEIVMESRF